MLPWLIYIMIIIVGLGLAAVLQVVIPLGAVRQPDWLLVLAGSAGCLAVAGLLLYFWIVVLELFIRLGPIYEGQDPYLIQCHYPACIIFLNFYASKIEVKSETMSLSKQGIFLNFSKNPDKNSTVYGGEHQCTI